MSEWTLKEKSTGDLTVKVEGKEWKEACEKAFNKIAKTVTLDGFRKGCAPKAILKSKISDQQCQVQAIDDHANEWMIAGLEEHKIMPLDRPMLDIKEMDSDKCVLVFTFPVKPEVTLGDYKGLEYVMDDTTVTDEEFEAELNKMRETYADVETTDEAAIDGDTVVIDFEGFKDGEAFEGGKAEGHELVLGSHSFIPGFEEQLIGVKAGDAKDVEVTFPEDYPAEELAGKPVVFKVTVHEVKRKVLPEVNDDFAKDINAPGVENVEDLKKLVSTRLEEGKKNAAEGHAEDQLMEKVMDGAKIDVPEVMVENEVKAKIQEMGQQMQQYGITLEQYLGMMGKKISDIEEDLREDAEKTVKARLILEKIAIEEKLEPTKEDIEEEYKKFADAYKMEVETIKQYVNENMLKADLAKQMAFDFIKDNAKKVEEKKAEKKAKKATKKVAKEVEKEVKAEEKAEKKTAKKTTKKTTAKKTTKKAADKVEE